MEIHLRQITLNKEAVSALCAQLAVALARHGAAVPPLRHMQDIIHSWQGSSTAPSCDSIDGAFECDDVYVESSKSASPEPWLSLCGLAGDDPSEQKPNMRLHDMCEAPRMLDSFAPHTKRGGDTYVQHVDNTDASSTNAHVVDGNLPSEGYCADPVAVGNIEQEIVIHSPEETQGAGFDPAALRL